MGCDCKLNIVKGASVYDVLQYLEKTYKIVYNGFTKHKNSKHEFVTVESPYFNSKRRMVFIMVYDCVEQILHNNDNIKSIPNESLYLSIHSDKEGIAFLTDIANHFGGYLCENDCANHDAIGYYKYFVGENNTKDRLFEMINSKFSVGYSIEITDFIRENIEEIKKCL